ncbi:MAG TPA: amidohydrolase family protein [Burkholderiales bacterium]
MAETTLLVTGGMVYDHDADTDRPAIADILVRGGRIAEVAPRISPAAKADETLDARGMLVLPGFVNAHYHSHDVLMKGAWETPPLEIWLMKALPPSYPKRSREEIRLRALLGAWECLRGGITTVQDMVTLAPWDADHLDALLQAYEEIGIRAVIALQFADLPGIDSVPFWQEVVPKEFHGVLSGGIEPPKDDVDLFAIVEEQYRRHKRRHPRIRWALGPSGPERCSRGFLERIAALSAAEGLPVYTHIYEGKYMALHARQAYGAHGGSLINWLGEVGLLNSRMNLAHSVWLLPGEIDRLAETGTNVVINPVGNLKTRSGVAPIRRLLETGVNTALGCDNCSCSDVQNMFQAMKLFCGLTAVSDPEPGPPTAPDALRAATLAGAKGAGLQGEVGALKPGYAADFFLVDLSDPSFVPLNSAARQLVYTESGRGVRTVVVDGRVVLRDGRLTLVDQDKLRESVERAMVVLRKDMERVGAKVDAIMGPLLEAYRRVWAADVGINRYVGSGRL